MKPAPTDIDPLPHRYRNLAPLTGLTVGQVRTVCALTPHRMPSTPGRPWGSPLPARVLLVLIHLPMNLTTRRARRPVRHQAIHGGTRIIDGTPISVRDQSITAISKNYRHSVNTQINSCTHGRRVVVASQHWPGNRNDVIVARHTVIHLLDGRIVLGDGRCRGIASISTPRPDNTGPYHPRRPLPGTPPDQGSR
jgi:hypothetical protein